MLILPTSFPPQDCATGSLKASTALVKALHACTVVVVHGKYPGGPVTKGHVITGVFGKKEGLLISDRFWGLGRTLNISWVLMIFRYWTCQRNIYKQFLNLIFIFGNFVGLDKHTQDGYIKFLPYQGQWVWVLSVIWLGLERHPIYDPTMSVFYPSTSVRSVLDPVKYEPLYLVGWRI